MSFFVSGLQRLNEINGQYQEKLLSIRARQAALRDDFLRREQQIRQQQYQQAHLGSYQGSGGAADPHHAFGSAAAAAAALGEGPRSYGGGQFNSSFRERQQFSGSGGGRGRGFESRVPHHGGGRAYGSNARYYWGPSRSRSLFSSIFRSQHSAITIIITWRAIYIYLHPLSCPIIYTGRQLHGFVEKERPRRHQRWRFRAAATWLSPDASASPASQQEPWKGAVISSNSLSLQACSSHLAAIPSDILIAAGQVAVSHCRHQRGLGFRSLAIRCRIRPGTHQMNNYSWLTLVIDGLYDSRSVKKITQISCSFLS